MYPQNDSITKKGARRFEPFVAAFEARRVDPGPGGTTLNKPVRQHTATEASTKGSRSCARVGSNRTPCDGTVRSAGQLRAGSSSA
jgi:hypothetical protein